MQNEDVEMADTRTDMHVMCRKAKQRNIEIYHFASEYHFRKHIVGILCCPSCPFIPSVAFVGTRKYLDPVTLPYCYTVLLYCTLRKS